MIYCWGPTGASGPTGPQGPAGDYRYGVLAEFGVVFMRHTLHLTREAAPVGPTLRPRMSPLEKSTIISAAVTVPDRTHVAWWWFVIGALTVPALIAVPRAIRRKADR